MAAKKEIEKHLKIALKEIGKIKPRFYKNVKAWVFKHPSYPIEYAGDSREEVIKNYPLYLREFIEQRLNDNLSPSTEKRTKGRGGRRKGAGRPKGSKKESKKRIYLPKDVANWFSNDPESVPMVRELIAKSRH